MSDQQPELGSREFGQIQRRVQGGGGLEGRGGGRGRVKQQMQQNHSYGGTSSSMSWDQG